MNNRRMNGIRIGSVLMAGLPLLLAMGCSSDATKMAGHQSAGDQFMDDGQYREAAIEYRNAVQIDPEQSEPHYLLGKALLNLGTESDLKNAFAEFFKAAAIQPGHLEAQLKLGLMYLVSDDAKVAQQKAEFILGEKPAHVEAQLLLGQALAAQNDLESARQVFKQLLKDHQDSMAAHTGMASVLVMQKRFNEAERHFKAALELDQDSPNTRLTLAAFYDSTGHQEQAREQLEETITRAPDTIPAYLSLSQYHLKNRDVDQAKAILTRLIEKMPEHEAGYGALANLYSMMKQPEAAQALLEGGLSKVTDVVPLRVQLADLHFRQHSMDQVQKQADALLATEEGRFFGSYFSGMLALMEGQNKTALNLFRQVIQERPDNAMAHYYLGLTQFRMGNINAAKVSYQAALNEDSSLVGARADMARIHLREGHPEASRGDVAKLNQLAPNVPDTLHLKGLQAIADRQPGKAVTAFTALVKMVPDSAEAHLQLGRAHLANSNNAAGRVELERALALDPMNSLALEALVRSDLSAGQPAAAEQRVAASIAQHPDHAASHYLMGELLLERGQQADGIASFEAALAADKTFLPAYTILGHLYSQSDHYEKSVSTLNQALASSPNDVATHMLLGSVHEQAGHIDEAVVSYQEALKYAPRFSPAANNLAWLYAQGKGNLDVALGLAQKAREHAPESASVADTLGWIYYLKGVNMAADGLLQEALSGMPEHPVVLYHAAMNSIELKETDKARAYLEQALSNDTPFDGREKAQAALNRLL